MIVDSIVNIENTSLAITSVRRINMNPREMHQEKYAAKKKPDKTFSEILSDEIDLISAYQKRLRQNLGT